ncbi:alpha-2-macroglobulin [Spirosoma taeanense]|uniref:Alpha-2-macroglobulin n=1 Tax=Spirosoma taeanense TaxID=2735870 RepID=A0A6M5YER1_9BACT|nr:alpha-2-macroglobulin family protein [Spirosoma taeanense]QJW92094.1 alpha-2-macroglobulin [Spirosoma taeanense]
MLRLFALALLIVILPLSSLAQNRRPDKEFSDYARDWQRADSLAAKGLPKSALAIVNHIYVEAKTARNYPQVAKAAMHRVIFRSYSDEDAYVELVRSLQADIQDTPEPAKSVLQSVLADVYWQYFQQNRYKFYDRATIGQPSGNSNEADFRTWDAHRLIETITGTYLASIEQQALLQKTPISAYDALLDKGDPDARLLRPTLFDLLAHRTISFFQNTEPDLLKPIFRFELDQPDYLRGPAVFANLSIQSRDSLSGRYQALRLYQQLLAFHLTDTDPTALADADVLRLAFVHGYSVVPEKDSLYRQTLTAQMTRYKNQTAEAIYGYQLAYFMASDNRLFQRVEEPFALGSADTAQTRWNRKQAADICRDLIKRYPKTLPGQQAAQLLNRLLQPTYSLQIEPVNAPGQPFRALVTYQNIGQIRYRILRQSIQALTAEQNQSGTEDQRKQIIKNWLRQLAIAEGSVTLPNDGDLYQHSVEMPLAGLPVGQYVLLTTDSTFGNEKVQYVAFSISSISYALTNTRPDNSRQSLFVVNRRTGEPLSDASVALLVVKGQTAGPPSARYQTDDNGQVNVPANALPDQTSFYYLISRGADSLLSDPQYNYNYRGNTSEEPVGTYTKLFTDRAIYRPGQPIYVKGLVYEGKANQFNVKPSQDETIELLDQYGERVSQVTVRTNEFGTYSTSFTAPVGRLTGLMTIQTSHGSTTVRVEEYKRPTFEVTIKPIQQSFRLEQTVTLSAQVKTFAGAVVDEGQVRFRVVRRYRPRWDWWSIRQPRYRSETEITNGVAQTDAQGNVSLSFPALPDRQIARQTNPIFDFIITIDVTDRAGETRSATRTLGIGYSALQIELAIPAQIEKSQPADSAVVTFPVRITNQSGENVSAKGLLTIYRLQPPSYPLRSRLWERPDRQLLSEAEFKRLFPNDLYANELDPRAWPKINRVQQQTLTYPTDSLFKPNLTQYAPGEYVAEMTATSSTGDTIREQAFFSAIDGAQPIASARADGWVQARKATAEPGGEAVFWVGNNQPGWVLMTVEEQHKIKRQEWLKTDGKPRRVAFSVTESQRGGFAVHFLMMQNGRLYQKSQVITVPFTNKQLTIETQTFRNKLRPGQQETWTLTIAGLNQTPAELVATLYDASLDAFARLDWPTTIYEPYRPSGNSWHYVGLYSRQSNPLVYRYRPEPPAPVRQYDQLSWGNYRFTPYGGPLFRRNRVSDQALRVMVQRKGKRLFGIVKNRGGSGVSGVSIFLKGTTTGVSTDTKGTFSLPAASDSKSVVLVFSLIGYRTNEITVSQKTISFRMQPDRQALEEEVAVQYSAAPSKQAMMSARVSKREAGGGGAAQAADAEATTELPEAIAAENTNSANPSTDGLINPRRNFNETAFFFPQLRTDEQGRVVLTFTMPEALTRWRLLAFAHTKDLKTGTFEREIITQKELMITANAPRFVREGDTIRLAARVNNLTGKALSGSATLELVDALTGEPMNSRLPHSASPLSITMAGGQSQSVAWTLVVPAGLEAVTCRLTTRSGSFTDGEEFTIPVLPNRVLITDTQPFWVNGSNSAETKTFKLKELANLTPELPVQHERLTVEVTSNPAWYALQALPYLMEYRYECAEQLFSRLYANSLAAHIVGSQPAFRQVIDEWKRKSPRNPLQSNEELKAVTLENSPWLAEARSEAERQAQLGQLLDQNRMTDEQQRTFYRLKQLQTENGAFRWFGGMTPDLSMTLHILSGFGHLQKLGVRFPDAMQTQLNEMLASAIRYSDAEVKEWITQQQQKSKTSGERPFTETQYLYARSFYPKQPMDKDVLAYLKQRVSNNWLKQSLQGQALAALALARLGDAKTANQILASLRERARESEEMGMYWPDNQSGLFWYQAPIETQAYLMEAFNEIAQDQATIDKMKRWLIRQKQTQSWGSTKATTEAVYALLLRGSDWLSTKSTAQVSLGGQSIESRAMKTEAITGYQKVTYAASEIKPEMGLIQITKRTEGLAWGALYWQHFEPLDRVMPGSAGLSVQKELFIQQHSPGGPVSSPVTSQTYLKPGDLIKVRLVLKTDRAMEYVHLKDGRASGFEPVSALSGYKFQNGLGYYESPRDASTDFFLSYLPIGTHVFEYNLRVAQTGDFSAGVATVQCFYAPEFSAHSAGGRVQVR